MLSPPLTGEVFKEPVRSTTILMISISRPRWSLLWPSVARKLRFTVWSSTDSSLSVSFTKYKNICSLLAVDRFCWTSLNIVFDWGIIHNRKCCVNALNRFYDNYIITLIDNIWSHELKIWVTFNYHQYGNIIYFRKWFIFWWLRGNK